MRSIISPIAGALALALVIWSAAGFAGDPPTLAVLSFELKDMTPLPDTPEEVQRTASIAPLLREVLAAQGGLELIDIDLASQQQADVAVGYLFDRPSEAAKLGRSFDADFVAVGRLHKPSFLFAYLMLRLVDSDSAELIGDYVIEIKGSNRKVVMGGVESLAEKTRNTLSLRQAPY